VIRTVTTSLSAHYLRPDDSPSGPLRWAAVICHAQWQRALASSVGPLARRIRETFVQIRLVSILVEDQDRALAFYTSVLGFQKKNDIPMGEFRWLTVTSPEGAAGVELVLEPMAFPPARTYQKALFEAGIPATAFMTADISAEFQKLKALGVKFRGEPANMGPVTVVLFEDTCGNLINLVQPAG